MEADAGPARHVGHRPVTAGGPGADVVARAGGVGAGDVNHHERDRLELLEANAIAWTSFVRRHAHVQPVAVALRCDGSGITYQELDARLDRIAAAFSRLGVGVGGRATESLMANRTEYVEALGGHHASRGHCGPPQFPSGRRRGRPSAARQRGDAAGVVDEEKRHLQPKRLPSPEAGMRRSSSWAAGAAPGAAHGMWADIFECDGSRHAATYPGHRGGMGSHSSAGPSSCTRRGRRDGRRGAVLTHLNLLMATPMAFMRTTRSLGNGESFKKLAPGSKMPGETFAYQRALVGSFCAEITHQASTNILRGPEGLDPVIEIRLQSGPRRDLPIEKKAAQPFLAATGIGIDHFRGKGLFARKEIVKRSLRYISQLDNALNAGCTVSTGMDCLDPRLD